MPLPVGFKVNGLKITSHGLLPPRVKKIIALLDQQPFGELMTSMEVLQRTEQSVGASCVSHPALADYREKVDNKLFWGSKKSIAQLRKQLAEPEETQNENQ